MNEWKSIIENAWENRELLKENETLNCINAIIEEIDKGRLRAAQPTKNGWKVNDWIKKAVKPQITDLYDYKRIKFRFSLILNK